MASKKAPASTELDILRINQGRLTCYIRGTTPLIYNAMSEKVRRGLLLPRKLTVAERAARPKHVPIDEYRSSVYTHRAPETLLAFPSVALKRALASAAIDIGGAKRTQVDRLVWAVGERVPIWGAPMLRMDVVRSADQNKTPDIRTRAILPEWACKLTLAFVKPTINETVVGNLLSAAGLIRGIGDFRQEKGAGNYGQFELVADDDPEWQRIAKEGGRQAQEAAIATPLCYDDETQGLYDWAVSEISRRGQAVAASPSAKRSKRSKNGNGAANGAADRTLEQ